MQIAVIIVSYNTRALLHAALQSVYAAQLPVEGVLSVIVVDNASRDGSVAMVAEHFPHATLIASPTNLGFTGGNNLALHLLGLRVSPPAGAQQSASAVQSTPMTPRYIFLLNPDTAVAPDALLQMVDHMEHSPRTAICGAHLHYGNGTFQHGAFAFPTLAQVALDFFPLVGLPGAQRVRASRVNGRYPASLWRGSKAFPVDFVLGAAMCVRAAAINDVGGLDDGYFMYCEEMDWALRMMRAGWKVYALPTAHVTHHEGQSSRQTRWASYEQLWRSRFRFYAKHSDRYPGGYQLLVRLLVRAGTAWRSRQARQRFGRGLITGIEVAREVEAYAAINRL
jgi:hypothetical protein